MQEAVGVVLEHEDLVLPADLEDLGATLRREGDSGRVVEVRDRVEELDAPALAAEEADRLAQRLRDESVVVGRDVHDRGWYERKTPSAPT